MAPSASRKGTQARASRARSSSRHSTPLTDASPHTPPPATPSTTGGSTTTLPKETPYTHTSTAALISTEASIETLIDKSNGSASKAGDPPGARDLHILHDKIQDTVNRIMTKRGEVCDRSMRQLAQRRKERQQMEREQEAARAEEERAKVKREEEEKKKEKRAPSKKRSHDEMDLDEDVKEKNDHPDGLPSVGAHGLARQDGVGVHEGQYFFSTQKLHAIFTMIWCKTLRDHPIQIGGSSEGADAGQLRSHNHLSRTTGIGCGEICSIMAF